MRKLAVLACLAVLFLGCGRHEQSNAAAFDANGFLLTTANIAFSDVDLGGQAARKGRLPETRQLGLAVANEQRALLAGAAPLLQHRGLRTPTVVEDRRAALHQNLSILPGQVFDRGWALAMVQDYDAILQGMSHAAQSNDGELRDFVARYRPAIAARRTAVNDLLSRLGGSPFNVAP